MDGVESGSQHNHQLVDASEVAMSALFREHQHAVTRFVSRYTQTREQCEDIVQETMLRAWRGIDRIDVTAASTRSYLMTIARNVLTDQWRASTSRPTLVHDQIALAAECIDDELGGVLDGWLIDESLRRLSEEHRAVIVLIYYEGRTVSEVAAHLDIAVGTVKSRSYYAVRALRRIFDELGLIP
ncbi:MULTISPECIES: sigma-70 family RNA polymerase sigma factor [Nocardiaceae]|uniref:RNA polymerase sigma factor n=1 Tax=Rhodococcoides trifolii TaxID=908250 RepID=A0A917CXD1_9NOCA|nr:MULTISPECIES: sigma-70 family RNA polymerase sigma factor [Rhodococcus]MDN5587400.1 sigma-70 family RNA polymerase sigma factor [Brevibacterium sp.]AYJ48731.1 sigma-70 family RNA polymerase sigma factor [Rhodococcus sp. P1Y]KQU45847.1 RNA polymerase subunit sigma [Rhodococcus sp. Leaf278]MBJ7324916.1 sigma-70 family RNA polymerase sigma factor [Rhodococcus sp. (in: high G+C Gram-positive bacteria)]MBW4781740.1 sigma-70 family RNA polymerase sigma factor [Rhodococcus fascians]